MVANVRYAITAAYEEEKQTTKGKNTPLSMTQISLNSIIYDVESSRRKILVNTIYVYS